MNEQELLDLIILCPNCDLLLNSVIKINSDEKVDYLC